MSKFNIGDRVMYKKSLFLDNEAVIVNLMGQFATVLFNTKKISVVRIKDLKIL